MFESLFEKVAVLKPSQECSSEVCQIFNNSFFYRTPPVAAFRVLT